MVEAQPRSRSDLPPFNHRVLELIDSYRDMPPGGYEWPAVIGTHGTTRDLYLGDARIARKSRGSHCVGITFEIFWRALEADPGGATGAGLDLLAVNRLRTVWYVPGDNKGRGAVEALEASGLGIAITDPEDALPGDFVQAWMNDGNGHSMIFTGWIRDAEHNRIGIRYWSSQPWTGGIGHSEHGIGDAPGQFAPSSIYIGRAGPPSPGAVAPTGDPAGDSGNSEM